MAGFYVGHGRHWDFFRVAGREDSELMALFYQTLLQNAATPLQQTDGWQLITDNASFGIGLLMKGQQLSSAFPYVSIGHVWPVELDEIYAWDAPYNEAQLIGSCHGAKVGFFDTQYAFHKNTYRVGGPPLNFTINALAYQVWPTQFADAEQEALMGNMKAYLPLSDEGDFVASADEIQFLSRIEAIRRTDFYHVPFVVYTVTIALPDDFPMRLDVYTPEHAIRGTFAVGDRLSGACWLFGQLATV